MQGHYQETTENQHQSIAVQGFKLYKYITRKRIENQHQSITIQGFSLYKDITSKTTEYQPQLYYYLQRRLLSLNFEKTLFPLGHKVHVARC